MSMYGKLYMNTSTVFKQDMQVKWRVTMTNKEYFDFHFNALKSKYPSFVGVSDYHLFTILSIKYFFFDELNIAFDQDHVLDFLTDGPNDGGIDAIFNDPTSEGNDVIIVQSKYYIQSPLSSDQVVGELYKISETIKDLRKNKVAGYNDAVVTAYRNATSQMEDSGQIRVYFFTSFLPSTKKDRNKLQKSIVSYFTNFDDIVLNYKDDIEAQIDLCDNGKLYVEYDRLWLDAKDNYLEYENSAIVNISAKSLQDLQNRRRNGLLGLNLRYHVKNKKVDSAIQKTISSDSANFWYKNNGIVIVCEDYIIDGKEVKLTNFSIVNGGQTTTMIGSVDIPDTDFFVQCKIVKTKGSTPYEKDKFIHSIAEATNSQKPIKDADIRANGPEQLRLTGRLKKKGVYYITKRGDKVPKQYKEPYQFATLEQVGKISLASVLQMPGTARSNSIRMYKDEYYYPIFDDNAKEGVIADILKIGYYYDVFVKTQLKGKGYDEVTVLPMMKNGKTFQLACVTLLAKIINGVFEYDTIASDFNNLESLKITIKSINGLEKIIANNRDDEEEVFFKIFSIIGDEILGYCFENARDKAMESQKSLAPSDYVKSDNNYYKDVIKRLWGRYNQNKLFKESINSIMIKSN